MAERGAKFEGKPCIKCGSTIRSVNSGDCVECNRARCRRWHLNNLGSEELRLKKNARYWVNRETVLEQSKIARRLRVERDPEGEREKKSRWYQANRDDQLERRREKYEQQSALALYNNAKLRAERKNWGFTLTLEHVNCLVDNTPICPVLGIPFVVGKGGREPGSRTLDRFGNEPFYTDDNTRLISWRANNLKSNGKAEEFEAIVRYMKASNDNDLAKAA